MSGSSSPKDNSFIPVGNGIWLSRGEEGVHEDDALFHPTVIIILGWMGAQLVHLHKYTQKYRETYPKATQVLIESKHSAFWSSETMRKMKLKPAAELLASLGCIPPTNQRILVHSFSNGGLLELTTLGSILPITTTSKLPPSIIVIDSAPGAVSLGAFTKAFSAGIRQPAIAFLFRSLLVVLWFVLKICYSIGFENLDSLSIIRKAMLQERVLPWTDKRTPRLYVYSKKDELVGWKDVQAHAEESRRLGFSNVTREMYDDTPHVAHARADPKRYWGTIGDIWGQGCRIFSDD